MTFQCSKVFSATKNIFFEPSSKIKGENPGARVIFKKNNYGQCILEIQGKRNAFVFQDDGSIGHSLFLKKGVPQKMVTLPGIVKNNSGDFLVTYFDNRKKLKVKLPTGRTFIFNKLTEEIEKMDGIRLTKRKDGFYNFFPIKGIVIDSGVATKQSPRGITWKISTILDEESGKCLLKNRSLFDHYYYYLPKNGKMFKDLDLSIFRYNQSSSFAKAKGSILGSKGILLPAKNQAGFVELLKKYCPNIKSDIYNLKKETAEVECYIKPPLVSSGASIAKELQANIKMVTKAINFPDQVGAFNSLDNAFKEIKAAEKNVYDECRVFPTNDKNGKRLYRVKCRNYDF